MNCMNFFYYDPLPQVTRPNELDQISEDDSEENEEIQQ